jgi:hypothetical protein
MTSAPSVPYLCEQSPAADDARQFVKTTQSYIAEMEAHKHRGPEHADIIDGMIRIRRKMADIAQRILDVPARAREIAARAR